MIAYLGTGLLGANFTKALLKKGEQVQVWNRTASKAKALEADGAKAFDNAAGAVKGANRIHMTLKDDAAVNEVLEQASSGFEPGVIIIDHTTTSAQGAVERSKLWKSRGFTYIHAPVFMGPGNALEGTGSMMVSGDPEVVALIEPELARMTGKVMNWGADPGRAAGIKLLGNLFLMCMTAGIADTLSLAGSLGISHDDVSKLFDAWNPAAMLPVRMKRMMSAAFDQPSWELSMARKDARLMMEQADKTDAKLMVIPEIADEMDKWIDKGHGQNDWTIFAKDSVS